MNKTPLALILAALTIAATSSAGHGGGLNAQGCHNQTGGSYHCHSSATNKNGRSGRQKRIFRDSNPCPSTGKTRGPCPGYHVDHRTALSCGGSDTPSNMQWLSASANLRKGGCRR